MKIGIASDIHTEFGNQRELKLAEHVDVLILAGDIGYAEKAADYAHDMFGADADHIVMVAGNHEYYGRVYQHALDAAREAAAKYDNIHFLENDRVVIDGITFLGATCWTDYRHGGNKPLNMMAVEDGLNDYRRIRFYDNGSYRKIRATDIDKINAASRAYLFNSMEHLDPEKTVIVMHHAPCSLSINPKYVGSPLNAGYCNVWGNELAYNGPKLLVHGHVHDPVEYMLGNTRVISNPIGYPGENPDVGIRIIEI